MVERRPLRVDLAAASSAMEREVITPTHAAGHESSRCPSAPRLGSSRSLSLHRRSPPRAPRKRGRGAMDSARRPIAPLFFTFDDESFAREDDALLSPLPASTTPAAAQASKRRCLRDEEPMEKAERREITCMSVMMTCNERSIADEICAQPQCSESGTRKLEGGGVGGSDALRSCFHADLSDFMSSNGVLLITHSSFDILGVSIDLYDLFNAVKASALGCAFHGHACALCPSSPLAWSAALDFIVGSDRSCHGADDWNQATRRIEAIFNENLTAYARHRAEKLGIGACCGSEVSLNKLRAGTPVQSSAVIPEAAED